MKWSEVKKLYPNQFVLLKVLKSHIEDNKKYIDDMAVVRAIDNPREAAQLLVRSQNDDLVYHTGKEDIVLEIRQIRPLRGLMI